MKITSAMLRDKGVWTYGEIARFKAEWPDGCEVSIETIHRAYKLGINIVGAAQEHLDAQVWAAYQEANALNWRTYREAITPHVKAYHEATAHALMIAIEAMERDQAKEQTVENSPTTTKVN